MDEKRKRGLILLAFFIVITLAVGFLFGKFVYAKTCTSKKCFNLALSKCKRATFYEKTENAEWYYKIRGKNMQNECMVYVKLSQIKKGDISAESAEGKEMVCYMPYSVVEFPQQNMEKCHGPLKEEIQDILIKKMHSYLLENIGEISREFKTII